MFDLKQCTVIYNPNSGKGISKDSFKSFFSLLEKNHYQVEFITTKYAGHAKEIIETLPFCDLVISLGGDGTFNEVVTGNLQRKDPLLLSHIPLGTTNDIGAMFGLNKNMINNLKLILNGTVRTIDICTVNSSPFVYVAGCGKFMNVPYETPRKLKKKFGYFAYLYEGAKNIFSKTHLFDISYTLEGKTYHGLYSFLAISNATRIAGMNLYKDVTLDDGMFEVLLCNLTKRKDILKSLYYLKMSNDISKVPGFNFIRTNHLRIRFHSNPPTWCLDGEKMEEKRKVYDIAMDQKISMLLPKEKTEKLFQKKN